MSLPKLHPSLPAPVSHSPHIPASQSKSHLLAGVQDAYWSDDEAEDAECPLCLEEMDISDVNFKPCPCGYQICRFCWHHIKENLNGRCPACRREYSDDAVQFKPIAKEDHKRLTQQKKQRERERKDLDTLGRRHFLNVRVVQRNVVYVVGLGSRYVNEELIPTLRSNEYFGQYGKITKMLLVKRTPPGGRFPILGLYITYYRREDAVRAIAAVDGAPSPSGGGDVMRASYGTTKYCIAFLRGLPCTTHGCMDLHEWGDEKDCFTKEDLSTLKHTMKDIENRQRTVSRKKSEEKEGLPRSAGWGKPLGLSSITNASGVTSARANRRSCRSSRSGQGGTEPRAVGDHRISTSARQQIQQERRLPANPSSQASSSRPATPAVPSLTQRPATPAAASTGTKQKSHSEFQPPMPPRSPTSPFAIDSDTGSLEAMAESPALSAPSISSVHAPPGLSISQTRSISPPPGISSPSTAPSPLPPIREPSSSYQISMQAQALLEDVMNRSRRDSLSSVTSLSPFPDLDRTLQYLSGGDGESGFNFNLDPKVSIDDDHFDTTLPGFDTESDMSISGFFDPFSTGRPSKNLPSVAPPPGLPYTTSPTKPFCPPALEKVPSVSPGYTGSFNPFSESLETISQSHAQRPSPVPDDDSSRRMSRFGFARERQGPSGFSLSGTSSPLLSANTSLSSLSLAEASNASSVTTSHTSWQYQRHQDFGPPPGLGLPLRTGTPASARGSPLASYALAQTAVQSSRFQPFNMGLGEVSLNDVLGIGRERIHTARDADSDNQSSSVTSQSGILFQDPAIMSSAPYAFSPGDLSHGPCPAGSHSMIMDGGYSPQFALGRTPGMSLQSSQCHLSGLRSSGSLQSPISATIPSPIIHSPALTQNFGAVPSAHTTSSILGTPSAFPLVPVPTTAPTSVPSSEHSPLLSAADFPALPTASTNVDGRASQGPQQPHILPTKDDRGGTKPDRKTAKKTAVAEKAVEQRSKGVEKDRLAKEKERAGKAKSEERERFAKQKMEDKEKDKERIEKDKLATQKKLETEMTQKGRVQSGTKPISPAASSGKASSSRSVIDNINPNNTKIEDPSPMPILSKMPKKSKPVTKPIKIPREEDNIHDSQSSIPSAVTTNAETPQLPVAKLPNVSEVANSSAGADASPSMLHGANTIRSKTLSELLEEIDIERGPFYLDNHPFFDISKINPASKMSLDYKTMARALSAFPVGGGSFTDNASARLNDKTVASFQQLLETLTQTMSDLVQLLPQTTWGSIFDVLSQDLKDLKREYTQRNPATFDGLVQDDLPEDIEDEEEYDIDQHTPTMDKRAKWMEIQLSKLEELHRDVNAAAVRAILASNDRGWDPRGCLPHVGNTLARFEHLGFVDTGEGTMRRMTTDELEKKLVVAKEAAVFAETEMKEAMQAIEVYKP